MEYTVGKPVRRRVSQLVAEIDDGDGVWPAVAAAAASD